MSSIYYLSDRKEETYDETKEGKVKDGKYMIVKSSEINPEALNDQMQGCREALKSGQPLPQKSESQLLQEKKAIKAKYGNPKVVPIVYEIISISPDNLILQRIAGSGEKLVGEGRSVYTPYTGGILPE